MTERTNLTNFLLLTILGGILLVSGSLQCAFDCLTQAEDLRTNYSLSERVDVCHPEIIEYAAVTSSCLNKACHEYLPYQRDLGQPQIYRLVKVGQPLNNTSREPSPQYRSGTALPISVPAPRAEIKLLATTSDFPPQKRFSIRSTVLLC